MKDNNSRYVFLFILASLLTYKFCLYLEMFKINPYVNYFIVVFGVSFSLYKIIIGTVQVVFAYKSYQKEGSLIKLKKSLFSSINSKLAGVIYQEMVLVYFSLIRWKGLTIANNRKHYSYYKANTTMTLYSVLLFMVVLETIIMEIVFALFNVTLLRYLLLIASIYTVLFLLAHIKASIYTKHYITNEKLILFNGLLPPIEILLEDIQLIKINKEMEMEESVRYGLISKLELFNFYIELKKEYSFGLIYGTKKISNKITFFVDEAKDLLNEISQKIVKC